MYSKEGEDTFKLGHTAQVYPIRIIIAPKYTIHNIRAVRGAINKEVVREYNKKTTMNRSEIVKYIAFGNKKREKRRRNKNKTTIPYLSAPKINSCEPGR